MINIKKIFLQTAATLSIALTANATSILDTEKFRDDGISASSIPSVFSRIITLRDDEDLSHLFERNPIINIHNTVVQLMKLHDVMLVDALGEIAYQTESFCQSLFKKRGHSTFLLNMIDIISLVDDIYQSSLTSKIIKNKTLEKKRYLAPDKLDLFSPLPDELFELSVDSLKSIDNKWIAGFILRLNEDMNEIIKNDFRTCRADDFYGDDGSAVLLNWDGLLERQNQIEVLNKNLFKFLRTAIGYAMSDFQDYDEEDALSRVESTTSVFDEPVESDHEEEFSYGKYDEPIISDTEDPDAMLAKDLRVSDGKSHYLKKMKYKEERRRVKDSKSIITTELAKEHYHTRGKHARFLEGLKKSKPSMTTPAIASRKARIAERRLKVTHYTTQAEHTTQVQHLPLKANKTKTRHAKQTYYHEIHDAPFDPALASVVLLANFTNFGKYK
jgi:hypothetical protein